MPIENSSQLDAKFHALSDPTRRRIVAELIDGGEKTAGCFTRMFEFSQPTVSGHLSVLEKARLLARRVEGRKHYFSIKPDELFEVKSWFERHHDIWIKSLGRLERLLDDNSSVD